MCKPGAAALVGLTSLLAVASSGSCAFEPVDPMRALVDALAEAAEDRDADGILEHLDPGFSAQGGLTRADAAASLRRYFAGYERIDVEVYDVETLPGEAVSRVRARVGFTGQANRTLGLEGLLPPSAVYRFDLDVVEYDGAWRVTRAAWERATPATPGS
jgi:hypothetical protein